MAALKMNEDAQGRIVLQPSLVPNLGSLLSGLFTLLVLLAFIVPAFMGENIDWETIIIYGLFFGIAAIASLASKLVSTRLVFDPTTRTLTTARGLPGITLSSSVIPFGDITNIDLRSYRQQTGRTSHDAWRVDALARDGRRIPLNWDGNETEMTALARRLSARLGVQLNENQPLPRSTAPQVPGWLRELMPASPTPPTVASPSPMQSPTTPPPAMPTSTPTEPMSPTEPTAPMEPTTEMQTPAPAETQPPTPAPYAPAADLRTMPIGALEQRIANDPMDAEARYVLARKYQANGQWDRALASYQEVLHLEPTNANAQNDIGVGQQQRGKRTEAEAAYRRALALDPFFSTAHLNLGMLLRSMNRAAEASQEFYKARQNARGDAETRMAEAASTGAKIEPQLSKM